MNAYLARCILAATALVSVSTPAGAITPQECATAAETAESLHEHRRFLEAQRELLVCSSEQCPKFIRVDCLRSLDELRASLSSVVVRARSSDGKDVLDAQIEIDGRPVERPGTATFVDPGSHVVRASQGAARGEEHVLVVEGEKLRIVTVQLQATREVSGPPRSAPSDGRGPWPYVTGGVAVAGFAAFGLLQILAQNRYDDLESRCSPRCSRDEVDAVRRQVTLSGIALGVGIVAAGVTVALWLWPRSAPPSSSALTDAVLGRF